VRSVTRSTLPRDGLGHERGVRLDPRRPHGAHEQVGQSEARGDQHAALEPRGQRFGLRRSTGDAPPSQLELAGLCGLLPAQIVPVIDELERRGFVAR
jgi:hypothetical protein